MSQAPSCSGPASSTWTCSSLGTSTIAAPATCSGQVWLIGSSITTRRFRSYWPDLLADADRVESFIERARPRSRPCTKLEGGDAPLHSARAPLLDEIRRSSGRLASTFSISTKPRNVVVRRFPAIATANVARPHRLVVGRVKRQHDRDEHSELFAAAPTLHRNLEQRPWARRERLLP